MSWPHYLFIATIVMLIIGIALGLWIDERRHPRNPVAFVPDDEARP